MTAPRLYYVLLPVKHLVQVVSLIDSQTLLLLWPCRPYVVFHPLSLHSTLTSAKLRTRAPSEDPPRQAPTLQSCAESAEACAIPGLGRARLTSLTFANGFDSRSPRHEGAARRAGRPAPLTTRFVPAKCASHPVKRPPHPLAPITLLLARLPPLFPASAGQAPQPPMRSDLWPRLHDALERARRAERRCRRALWRVRVPQRARRDELPVWVGFVVLSGVDFGRDRLCRGRRGERDAVRGGRVRGGRGEAYAASAGGCGSSWCREFALLQWRSRGRFDG